MKKFLILLILPIAGFAQSNEFGKQEADTFYFNNGVKYYPGFLIQIGKPIGTNNSHSFRYIHSNPEHAIQALPPICAGKRYEIVGLKNITLKQKGEIFYVQFKRGWDLYYIDLVNAINSGEIIVPGIHLNKIH